MCEYCGVIHGGIEELYHLERDPKEIQNIAEERPEIVKDLRKKLFAWLSDLRSKSERILISREISKLKMMKKI